MQKLHKTYTSLTGVGVVLSVVNLSGSLVDQVTLLVKGFVRKDKYQAFSLTTSSSTQASLSVVQRDLEAMRLENASKGSEIN